MKKALIIVCTAAVLAPIAAWGETFEEIAAGAALQMKNITSGTSEVSANAACAESEIGRVLPTLYARQFSLQDKVRTLETAIEKTSKDLAYLCSIFKKWHDRYLSWSDRDIIDLAQHPERADYPTFNGAGKDLGPIRDTQLSLELAGRERAAVTRDIEKTDKMIKELLGKIGVKVETELPDEL